MIAIIFGFKNYNLTILTDVGSIPTSLSLFNKNSSICSFAGVSDSSFTEIGFSDNDSQNFFILESFSFKGAFSKSALLLSNFSFKSASFSEDCKIDSNSLSSMNFLLKDFWSYLNSY